VTKTTTGYANGKTESPTYEEVCRLNTGHAETVEIIYDEKILPLTRLLDLYADVIDPTSLNRQGNDVGTQYRTGIYYIDEADEAIIQGWLVLLGESLTGKVVIECELLRQFFPAEDYHQDYLDKNPNGYSHIPKAKFEAVKKTVAAKANVPEELRKILTPIQYEVAVNGATEPPFQNAYFDNFEAGIYVDIITGIPLFVSGDKFESGCGWPSFSKPIDDSLLRTLPDNSYGRERTEVRSSQSDAHLGHVFDDGIAELGGLRYCINSASLRFISQEDMPKEGYAQYLVLLKHDE
jgi:peptide methionine sulfoxide reductase msrA/msrB